MATIRDLLVQGITPRDLVDAMERVFSNPGGPPLRLEIDLLSRGNLTRAFVDFLKDVDVADLRAIVELAAANRRAGETLTRILATTPPANRGAVGISRAHLNSARVIPGTHAITRLRATLVAYRCWQRLQVPPRPSLAFYVPPPATVAAGVLGLAQREAGGRAPVRPNPPTVYTDIDGFPMHPREICWNFLLRLRHEAIGAGSVSLPYAYNRMAGPTNAQLFNGLPILVQSFPIELFGDAGFAPLVVPVGAVLVFVDPTGVRGHYALYEGGGTCIGKNHPTGAGPRSVPLSCPTLASRYASVEVMVPW